MDIWGSFQVIKKHKWLILAVSGLSYLLMLFLAHFITNDYVSVGKLMVAPPPRIVSTAGTQTNESLSDPHILMQIFNGQEFLEEVVRVTKVAPGWTTLRNEVAIVPVDAAAEQGGGSATTVMEVTATTDDPHQSYVVADAVCNEFTHYVPELMSREFASNRRFLAGLVEEAQQKLTTAEANVKQWQEKHQALDVTSAAADYIKSIDKLEQQKADTQQKIEAMQVRINDLNRFMDGQGDTPPWLVMDQKSQHIPELQQMLSTERLKLFHLEQTLKPGEPALEDERKYVDKIQGMLHTEMNTSSKSLLAEREADLKEAQSKMAATEQSLKSLRDTWALAKNNLEYNHLIHDIDTWRKNYDDLLAQLYQARIAEQNARREGSITLLERPMPGSPVKGGLVRIKASLPFLLPLCILLGVGIAFILESLSKELQVRPRIEDALELPVLGSISRLPKGVLQLYQDIAD